MGQILNKIITAADDNLETFSLIWLDASVNKTDDNQHTQDELRATIHQLKTFEDSERCLKHILSTGNGDRIVLIVSGSLGRTIVPRIHNLDQVLSVYVYCQDQTANEQWSSRYPKVKAVVTDTKELIVRIQIDQEKRQQSRIYEPLPISIFDTKIVHAKLTTNLQGHLVHSQLLINCLLQMRTDTTDKNELISISKKIYRKNRAELTIINEFEQKYSSDTAISWYTRDTFLSRLLNKALRTQNIDVLFLFQFFIVDIRRQLEKLRLSVPIRAYRSQLMSNEELKKLKQSAGQFVSINSFFSATLDRNRAIACIENTDNFVPILFEIDAEPNLSTDKPFANIKGQTLNRDEEILFMLGSIFQIMDIFTYQRSIWIVKLKLCSDSSRQLDMIEDENQLLSFGHVLMTMGKIEEAEIYYRRLLEDFESNKHTDLARCYEALGNVADEKCDYDMALHFYEKSLRNNLSEPSKRSLDIASNYNNIGEIQQKKGYFKKAIENYEKALDVLGEYPLGKGLVKQAICFNNIGIACQEQHAYKEALSYYRKAYEIRRKNFPHDETSLGMSYNNIGNAYYLLKLYTDAIYYYQEALKLYKKTLPPHHPKYASTCNNIGAIYDDQGKYNEALSFYTDAAKIYRNIYPSTHPNVIKIEENIQRVLTKVKQKN
ncbi:unnamed protein product [Adineta ricciae]|uniref:Uncharacterized protein n=1 Tax=Adineta ricciae TaxID=249248 RepID=A0A813TYC4_ADIRI|nr:unnamed protein product [Adineta ricciae]CAF1258505.1 unnamed protein product [Adineta ricciae]